MSVIDAMIYLYVYQLSDIAILSIKGSDYCCITGLISKIDAIKLFPTSKLSTYFDKFK